MDKLSGFGFRGFRSFYGELQILPKLTEVNLVAGQNNSGKSNVLRFILHMEELLKKGPEGLDVPQVASPPAFEVVLRLGDRDDVHAEYCDHQNMTNSAAIEATRNLLAAPAFDLYSDGGVWLKLAYAAGGPGQQQISTYQQSQEIGAGHILISYMQARGMQYSSDNRQNAKVFLDQLRSESKPPPSTFVEASRRIDSTSIDGTPLIKKLAALQSPERDNDADRDRFNAINRFLRIVTDDSTATLEIPYTADVVNVRRGNLLLPLDSLGTGISQVVMLAAFATLNRRTVVCMEEPEVHLHPLLQRKLLRYLYEETDNQYVIATHSAHLLDSAIASVFHATYTDSGTTIIPAGNPAELSEVCYDLGYRPSDLLQTNCVIWVEGPSDRIYIALWLYLMNPDLIEGVHYSIMFYGGRLLNHLTADDHEVTEFIQLRRLNRHLAVVMDSDKSSQQARINKTKTRVKEEIDGKPGRGFSWVTLGRYIESYVPPEELTKVLKTLFPNEKFTENSDKYSDALRLADNATGKVDKIKVAKEVCKRWKSGLHSLDLHKQILALTELVEAANGLQSPSRPARVEPQFG